MDGLIQAFLDYLGVQTPQHRVLAIAGALIAIASLAYLGRRLIQWIEWRSQTSLLHIDVQLHTLRLDVDNLPHLEWEGVGKLKLDEVAEWRHLARAVQRAAMQTEHGQEWVVLVDERQHNQFLNQLVSMAGALPKLTQIAREMGYPVFRGLLVCEKYDGIPARLKFFLTTEEQAAYFSDVNIEKKFEKGRGLRELNHIARVRTLHRMGKIATEEGGKVPMPRSRWSKGRPVRVIREVRAGRAVPSSGMAFPTAQQTLARRAAGT